MLLKMIELDDVHDLEVHRVNPTGDQYWARIVVRATFGDVVADEQRADDDDGRYPAVME